MDPKSIGGKNKTRVFSDGEEDENLQRTDELKRIRPLVLSRFEADIVELWPQIAPLINHVVCEEVKRTIQSRFRFFRASLSQGNDTREEVITGSGTLKFKLNFCNQIPPIIFTTNDIKAENDEPLQVAICDATNSNTIIYTGPLSLARIEFFVLDGDFGPSQPQKEIHWTSSDFNENVLSPREGKRPLIVGNDLRLHLKNGVGFVESLSITDNSSWMKSKNFRLGAKIIDEKILAEFPRIGEAVSQPFRVMDHRGEGNKKLHYPSEQDEVWRLKGIGKDGTYHKNLSFEGIKTVGDFLKAYNEKGPTTLRKLLGNKVSDKTWNTVVENALKCDLYSHL